MHHLSMIQYIEILPTTKTNITLLVTPLLVKQYDDFHITVFMTFI